jgi:DNA polymerase III sliding clamp (beta) subunit (PCNA family)
MREAIDKIKALVAKKDIVPMHTHFIFTQGLVHAMDGLRAGSCACPQEGNFAVRAAELIKFLDNAYDDKPLKIKLEDGRFKISSGRLRANLPTLPVENFPLQICAGKPVKVKEGLLRASLRAVRPFVSDNATQPWAGTVWLKGGCAYATNNVCVVKAEGTGLPKDFECLVPFDTIDYILSRDQALKSVAISDSLIGFKWEDVDFNCSRLDLKFPGQVLSLFDNFPKLDFEVSNEWCKDFQKIAKFAHNDICMKRDKLVTSTEMGDEVALDIECPAPEGKDETTWSVKYLELVVANASHMTVVWQNGPRVFFKNDKLSGLALGITGK